MVRILSPRPHRIPHTLSFRSSRKRGRESFLDRLALHSIKDSPCLGVTVSLLVLNRRVGRLPLFDKSADYAAFEKVLAEAYAQTKIRIAAYCLMSNHWHLLLWPRHDGELSEVLRWITVTHTQRWHAYHHTAGKKSGQATERKRGRLLFCQLSCPVLVSAA